MLARTNQSAKTTDNVQRTQGALTGYSARRYEERKGVSDFSTSSKATISVNRNPMVWMQNLNIKQCRRSCLSFKTFVRHYFQTLVSLPEQTFYLDLLGEQASSVSHTGLLVTQSESAAGPILYFSGLDIMTEPFKDIINAIPALWFHIPWSGRRNKKSLKLFLLKYLLVYIFGCESKLMETHEL